MSRPRRVLLVGATGLVGRLAIEAAMNVPDVHLIALSRRIVPLPKGAKMEMLVADVTGWGEMIAGVRPETVICALGSTWRKSGGDEARFRAVDKDLVGAVAQTARKAGASNFVLVSSAGADRLSRRFYLRVKGEAEALVDQFMFDRYDILRPGLLRGERGADRRMLERLGVGVSGITDLFLQGKNRQYRSIDARAVAQAALKCTQMRAPGRFIHDNDAMLRLARQLEQGR
ncbi:uncharacterized protein YbjT (DUF2867 family) [Altererythrobacter atlanticus]|uniref:Uncharacterized protein n=1 Tax=Croceibacterium atlanticum TaxID=1267766 RepID=A0A0F7KRX7_9SPHN|nr:NAD(P)H-binding protein [Croceibacterium atlanticum]AKH42012.1 hypothetical protein WYH_00964 [Croceibacterium atlanticum]MBB5733420.1 uncharacterized protein YbjT (DUF2867 family) [Croceibacterium atlanticum]